MKKVQKILIALVIFSVSIVAVGCSSKDNNNKTASDKIKNEELVKKAEEAAKSVKSANGKIQSKAIIDISGKSVTTDVNMDTSMTKDPFVVKMSNKLDVSGKKTESMFYIAGDNMYVHNLKTDKWYKAEKEFSKKYIDRKSLANFESIIELLTSVKKNLKVEQKDSSYEATYSGNDDSVHNPFKKIMELSQPGAKQVTENMKIEKIDIKYVIDKKTFVPTECEIEAKITISRNGNSVPIDFEFTTKYSDINEVPEIKLPKITTAADH